MKYFCFFSKLLSSEIATELRGRTISQTIFPAQVCYSLQDADTKSREIRGLLLACDFLKLKRGTIVTYEEEDNINIGNIEIEVLPAYRYYLEVLSQKTDNQ